MKRYLLSWLILTASLLLAVAVFNIVIDPYGLFRLVDIPGLNSIKPTAGNRGAMSKAYQALRFRPGGLILGNSRSEVGFDPEHAAWPVSARPVLNLALPGTGPSTTLAYLQHVLANVDAQATDKPGVILWGIDFMDFLLDAKSTPGAAELKQEPSRLLTKADGSANPERWLMQAKDYAQSTLSLGAFLDSVQTLGNQRNPYSVNLTPLGFNPMREYLKITADEGYWNVFRQKDQTNTKAYLRRPMDIYDATGVSSPDLDDLRRVVSLCRQHGIALHLVIYPYHAHLLEIIRITGHWSAFDEWKRAIVRVIEEDAGAADTMAVPLWDFSGFTQLSMESVPGKGDRQTKMRWYWEAGHFKSALGDIVQDRVFGRSVTFPGFGVLLNSRNVDEHLAAMRVQEAKYRISHPQEVEDLERIAAEIRSQRQKPL